MTLIIFAKNLVHGRVKTRLAATIGNDRAMKIYQQLINYTCSVVNKLDCNKMVYYSDHIEWNDEWMATGREVQCGEGLGERMEHAFKAELKKVDGKTLIIGTDCFEITDQIILEAFSKLEQCDVVIGPASDGGYYLLGMKKCHSELFKNISWSTGSVFDSTLSICHSLQLRYHLMPVLNDIDEEKDLLQTTIHYTSTGGKV
ncbi:MAG: TIGR04282 family arsenosugar biosynthesis glycosyltransferase [Chitinophagaceae bacterium]